MTNLKLKFGELEIVIEDSELPINELIVLANAELIELINASYLVRESEQLISRQAELQQQPAPTEIVSDAPGVHIKGYV